ncbi:complement C1q-like protein 2 [Erpetoichthys calabaricus]|uniref:complement C1q-like protein 2 n=1 Tax=Erpetoichthys calabaricus TaxID=27687 RepID=UPI00223476BD|nr:complement C1q-like protein 2 [Erpetoichthys calabaricus]
MKAILGIVCLFYFLALSRAQMSTQIDNQMQSDASSMASVTKRLSELAGRLEELEKELRAKDKGTSVIFSATLNKNGYVGPFNAPTTIAFTKIHVNLGNGYNPSTGIFTAYRKGIYFFTFTAFLNSNKQMFVSLMKNNDMLVGVWDSYTPDGNDAGSNTAIVQLEVGDNVYVRLHEEKQIYDDGAGYTSFSGFLLLPL